MCSSWVFLVFVCLVLKAAMQVYPVILILNWATGVSPHCLTNQSKHGLALKRMTGKSVPRDVQVMAESLRRLQNTQGLTMSQGKRENK